MLYLYCCHIEVSCLRHLAQYHPSNNVLHYENTPMQYAAILKGCKNGNFQMKNCDIFLIFAQKIGCGYTLEPE